MHTSATTGSLGERRPFVVAHRAGNDLHRLRAAAALGLPLAEADVHLYRGRLEVRHLKTAGPLPLLWDRWRLASARAPRLRLETLLEEAHGGPELMLDLKGHDPRLAGRVAAAVARAALESRVSVCSQDWRLLERLSGEPDVRLVHSIGNARALARLQRLSGERLAGVSIHRRLLDAATVQNLRSRADMVLSWPVETMTVARQLVTFGVDGLISQAFEPIAAALGAREAALA